MYTPKELAIIWGAIQVGKDYQCWPARRGICIFHGGEARSRIKMKGHGNQLLHRLAYQAFNGPIPKTKQVNHTCHNTLCCNPAHLYAGTQKDNVRDCVKAGRFKGGINTPFGERQHMSILTDSSILQIRRLAKQGLYTQRMIATLFEVSPATICLAVSRKTWKHLP